MTEIDSTLPLILAVIILGFDVLVAGIIFLVLKNRGHPMTYVIPPFIVLSGIVSALLVYFNMNPPS